MAHIAIEEGIPGILGPMKFRPETTKPLRQLAEVLLRGSNTLTSAEPKLSPHSSRCVTIVVSASSRIAPPLPSTSVEAKSTIR